MEEKGERGRRRKNERERERRRRKELGLEWRESIYMHTLQMPTVTLPYYRIYITDSAMMILNWSNIVLV